MAVDFSKRKYLETNVTSSIRTSVFRKGDMIFKKGERGQIMYEIRFGSVGIYLDYKGPKEKLLVVKKQNEYFGEIALIEDRPRTATAVAMENDTELREISVNGFQGYVRQHPEVLKPIMNAMAQRFKEQRAAYLSACNTLKEFKEAKENKKPISEELQAAVDKMVLDSERHKNDK